MSPRAKSRSRNGDLPQHRSCRTRSVRHRMAWTAVKLVASRTPIFRCQQELGIVWNEATFKEYIKDPKAKIPARKWLSPASRTIRRSTTFGPTSNNSMPTAISKSNPARRPTLCRRGGPEARRILLLVLRVRSSGDRHPTAILRLPIPPFDQSRIVRVALELLTRFVDGRTSGSRRLKEQLKHDRARCLSGRMRLMRRYGGYFAVTVDLVGQSGRPHPQPRRITRAYKLRQQPVEPRQRELPAGSFL